MKIFLSGVGYKQLENVGKDDMLFILNTFADIVDASEKAKEKVLKLMNRADDFLLDSGAFTFMYNNKDKYSSVDWEEYVRKYADFINQYNVKNFFELDIDSLVGYAKVLELRKMLEGLTNKKCIPVWHVSRGKTEFINLCKEYPFIALGGFAGNEIPRNMYKKIMPMLIDEAHRHGTKIHGLGFTSTNLLPSYHFDTVDSTSWLAGQYGTAFLYAGDGHLDAKKFDGKHYLNGSKLHMHNFKEWVKYVQYAYKYL